VLADPTRAEGRTLNVGSGVETRILDLATRIGRLCELPEDAIALEPLRSWDRVVRRVANVSRLDSLYGVTTKTSLDEGLRRTVRWVTENSPR
jgi:UDP-glucose 4-epimerase